jgi:hypothetical protein
VRVEPTSISPVFAFEDIGAIITDSQMVCGETNQSFTSVELAGSFALPSYADAATVLLNGWRLRYLSGDNDVRTLGARTSSVAVGPGAINWLALGHIFDKDGSGAYEFCYVYTVIGWNSGVVDAVALNEELSARNSSFSNTTALLAVSPLAETGALADRRTVAALPWGFRLSYEDSGFFGGSADHHVLQLAHHMDHNEVFLEGGKEYGSGPVQDLLATDRRVDASHATLESYGIIKDNDLRRDVYYTAYVAVLGGDDIGVVRPPFTILPAEDTTTLIGDCLSPDGGTDREEYVVEDVPFDYALPLLTGWDLTYRCDDEQVTEVGIWLEDFSYEKAPDAPTGTIRYTLGSVLRDRTGGNHHDFRHKVDILGLNKRLPTDLVPQARDSQFCDTGPGGLLVTVANVGADDAPASMTRIQFEGGVQEDLPTPPLGKGFAVTLEPVPFPPSCPDPDCGFSISVDQTNAVVETFETNNTASGFCVG